MNMIVESIECGLLLFTNGHCLCWMFTDMFTISNTAKAEDRGQHILEEFM